MPLLLPRDRLDARRRAAAGGLATLTESLAADLRVAIAHDPHVPAEKARMTAKGFFCPFDGAKLEFDPYVAGRHHCPRCDRWLEGAHHDEFRRVFEQLWLAERAVHAALLALLRPEHPDRPAFAAFADRVLDECAERYLHYPNRDNVLGPTRPFFSTYLESNWMLYLAIALDLRETAGDCTLGGRVRERVLEPSARLIQGYDEGDSNRQVWNDAAMLAVGVLLDDAELRRRAVDGQRGAPDGRYGLRYHLARGILADGTWSEGENYHLFAHRGLWFGVALAEAQGVELGAEPVARFERAFAAPFLSRLPDFTYPSRRDAPYAVTLRQWRIADSAELGYARDLDDETRASLAGALAELYRPVDLPRRVGRWKSTAESELNDPAGRLTRSDLGWRSLLLARESLGDVAPAPPASRLLPAQGLAVLRREAGCVYAALDYGISGGGHGHPDRLDVLLSDGAARWCDDSGTGSYADPSLAWYRSTLAHEAPLVNGENQRTEGVAGSLAHWDEREAVGWVDATVDTAAPGVTLRRALVLLDDYLVDALDWRAADASAPAPRVELPTHAPGELTGVSGWRPGVPHDAPTRENGFAWLEDVERGDGEPVVRLDASLTLPDGARREARAWVCTEGPVEWWRARAPGVPGSVGLARFQWPRVVAHASSIVRIWSWRGAVTSAWREGNALVVERVDAGRDRHERVAEGWRITRTRGDGSVETIALGDARPPVRADVATVPRELVTAPEVLESARIATARPLRVPRTDGATTTDEDALVFELARASYRRSEPTWEEAGAPTATVRLSAEGGSLVVEVVVTRPGPPRFIAPGTHDGLDNDPACTRGDGVHLLVSPGHGEPDASGTFSWLLVPRPGSAEVDVHVPEGYRSDLRPDAGWRLTPTGYALRAALPLDRVASGPRGAFRLDLLVNLSGAGRERREGQLVLSGGEGEFVYLRSDRHPLTQLLAFTLA